MAEELFGYDCVINLDMDIDFSKIPMSISEMSYKKECDSEIINEEHVVMERRTVSSFYKDIYETDEFANDNIDFSEADYLLDAA